LKKQCYYLLASRRSIPSAKLLRDQIKSLNNLNILVTTDIDKLNIILRYGCHLGGPNNILNSIEFIRNCSSKRLFSLLMQENNIYSPIYYRNEKPESFPVLIRKTLNGQHGEGIIYCSSLDEFNENNNNNYWTPFVSLKYELRVHCLNGEIAKVFVKKKHNENDVILNSENSHFSLVEVKDNYKRLFETIEKMNFFLKDSFCALDIGYDEKKKEYFILEGNSAPGLNESTARLYAEYICGANKNNEVTLYDRTEENSSGG